MNDVFVFGLLLGIRLAKQWPPRQARKAMDAAHFMVAGCIDAPERIPAGASLSFDYGDGCYGIDQATVTREPHLEGTK